MALGSAGSGLGAQAATARDPAPRVLTAWMRGEQSWAGVWTPGAKTLRGIALPARAHQLLVLPASGRRPLQALVLARRPGEYLLRMEPLRNQAP